MIKKVLDSPISLDWRLSELSVKKHSVSEIVLSESYLLSDSS